MLVPRAWRNLLSWLADPDDRDFMLADLEEELEARASRDGLPAARCWYRSQVLRSLSPCLGARLRRLTSRLPRTELVPDSHIALRGFAKTPLVAVVTVVSLGLGIGAVATVFTVTNALLLRAPGIPHPETLVGVVTSDSDGTPWGDSSFADYESIAETVEGLESTAASQADALALGETGSSERIFVERVTANYFETMGVTMRFGRAFHAREAQPENAERVAVVSYRLWQERFEGSAGALGRSTLLNGHPYTIIGVAPPGLLSRDGGLLPDAWIPIGAPEGSGFISRDVRNRKARAFSLVGRLRDGTSLESVQSQLDILSARLHASYPDAWEDDRGLPRSFTVLSEKDARLGPELRSALKGASFFLLSAGGLVVLLACANVAGLFLARGQRRRREMAVRVSLGASRSRLVGMLLVESLLLACAGGVLGVILAHHASAWLSTFRLPLGLPLRFDFSLDFRVVAFAALVSALATLAFGLFPAIEASRLNLVPSLSAAGAAPRSARFRARNLLVVVQLAASVALLAGAGFFMRAMGKAASLDVGLSTDDVAVMSKEVPDHETDPRTYVEALRKRLESSPEVEEAHFARSTELSFLNWRAEIEVPGYERSEAESTTFPFNSVTPGYLEMLRVPLVSGRTFTTKDGVGAPLVAVINERFAARFWPDTPPLGKSFTVVRRRGLEGGSENEPVTFQVIGVVRDGRYPKIQDAPHPFFWTVFQQDPSRSMVIHLRGRPGSAERLVGVLHRDVELAPNELTLLLPTTLRALADVQLIKLLVPSRALAYGGGFGLLLSIIGVYGLVSLTVATRRREIAIRMAVGAGRNRVLAAVVTDVLRLTLAGLAIGMIVVIPVARLVQSRLFGVEPLDPVALGSSCVVLILTVIAASYIPARRAAAISPTEILRHE